MKFTHINDVLTYLNTLGMFRMKPGQNRVEKSLTTLQLLPMPFFSLQIVGTNGKGSTSTFLSQLAQEHGLKTGLYTSPHFVSPKERIQINGKEVENSIWVECANKVYEKGKDLTYFEFLTVLCVEIFTKQQVDIAIFEAGLGGKFDATTALNCPYIAFTPIDLDHTQILGKNIKDIATDKAHAILPHTQQVVSTTQCPEVTEILTQHCKSLQVPFLISEPIYGLKLGIKGQYQAINSSLALSIWKNFFPVIFEKNSCPEKEIKALEKAFIPGRIQYITLPYYNKINFNMILDGGHNAHGLIGLKNHLIYEEITPSAVIFSCMADKDLNTIIPILQAILNFAACPLFIPQIQDNERAIQPHILAELLQKEGIQSFPQKDISQALESTAFLSTNEKPVLICGSLYLLADFYTKYPRFLNQNP